MGKNVLMRALLAIAIAAALTSATASALLSVTIRKPLVIDIIAQEATLRLDSIAPIYDETLNIYRSFNLTITNTASNSINAKITINLYNSTMAIIAHGETSVSIPKSTETVIVPLVWATGKNLTSLASGRIIIEQRG